MALVYLQLTKFCLIVLCFIKLMASFQEFILLLWYQFFIQKHSQERRHQVPRTTCAVYAFDAPFKLGSLYFFQYRITYFVRTTHLYYFFIYRVPYPGCTDVDGSWRTSPLSKTTSRFQENHHSLHHCCVSDMLGWVYDKRQAAPYWTTGIKNFCP